jgi:hypothetical protein
LISADGQTVAIGAYQADAASGAGYVQVYQLAGTTWTQVGADIVGLTMATALVFGGTDTDASFVTIGANSNDSDGLPVMVWSKHRKPTWELDTNWRKHYRNADSRISASGSPDKTVAIWLLALPVQHNVRV